MYQRPLRRQRLGQVAHPLAVGTSLQGKVPLETCHVSKKGRVPREPAQVLINPLLRGVLADRSVLTQAYQKTREQTHFHCKSRHLNPIGPITTRLWCRSVNIFAEKGSEVSLKPYSLGGPPAINGKNPGQIDDFWPRI